MKVPVEQRIFDHAFHHNPSDYEADACFDCGKPESYHEWTTTFGRSEVDGIFACPICGSGSPHQHTSIEIAAFRTEQGHKGAME